MSHPKVGDAEKLAKRDSKDAVIIFHIDGGGGIGYASYGKDRAHCKAARAMADVAFDAMLAKLK